MLKVDWRLWLMLSVSVVLLIYLEGWTIKSFIQKHECTMCIGDEISFQQSNICILCKKLDLSKIAKDNLHQPHYAFKTAFAKHIPASEINGGPYYNKRLFDMEYSKMVRGFKVYVYPDVYDKEGVFSNVFSPHHNPYDPKLGNYFSEHMFKINLMNSSFLTENPDDAELFFLPFSVNAMRNDRRIRSEASIANFVAAYVQNVSYQFRFWNQSHGADHFYVCCHSICREASSKFHALQHNAVKVTCSSNYFQKFYVPHKDIPIPQVWPRPSESKIAPPQNRTMLAFFAGRVQNSRVREKLLKRWMNDSEMDIYSGTMNSSYEAAFQKSKFCLHVKGYEVNTARISDAIHFGCVPVIISDYYDLPFSDVLDWTKFSLIISHFDIPLLKDILLSISDTDYLYLHRNVCEVRRYFEWHMKPEDHDAFYMTMYQIWQRRNLKRNKFGRTPYAGSIVK